MLKTVVMLNTFKVDSLCKLPHLTVDNIKLQQQLSTTSSMSSLESIFAIQPPRERMNDNASAPQLAACVGACRTVKSKRKNNLRRL